MAKETVAPVYPQAARRRGIQGDALVVVLVDVEGHPVEVVVKESRPLSAFGHAAKHSVSQWRFQKVKHEGKDTGYIIYAPVTFRLSNE